MNLVLSQQLSKYIWSAGISIGLYFLAAPLALLVGSCAFLVFHISDLAEWIRFKKNRPIIVNAIVVLLCALSLSYCISLLNTFDEFSAKFLYWMLYGPMLMVLFAAGFIMQKKLADLMGVSAMFVLVLQLWFTFFSRNPLLVREFSVGVMIFLPVALFYKQTGWRNIVLVLLVFTSGLVVAFSEQRSLLVGLFFELVVFNIVAFCRRSFFLTAIFLIGFLVGGNVYVKSVTDTTEKSLLLGISAISKRVGNGDPREFTSHSTSLVGGYSDRLGLYAVTLDKLSSQPFFGYSKLIPFEKVIMNSEAKVIEQYKSINYVPSHPHNFMLRAYWDMGVLSILYCFLFVLLFFYFGVSGLTLSLLSVYGIYGLVESPTPIYLFFLTGVLMAGKFNRNL